MKHLHTLGPWKAVLNDPCAAIEGHLIKRDDDVEQPIALLWVGGGTKGKPTQIANAHLIAAAPELLDALESTLRALEGQKAADDGYTVHTRAIKKAKAAITKASTK